MSTWSNEINDANKRFRMMNWRLLVILGGISGVLAISWLAAYDGRRIRGQIKLEKIEHPDDVRELSSFMERLEEIKNWQPHASDKTRLELVGLFSNLHSNQQFGSFSDLIRVMPKNEPTLNDSLELLSRPATNNLLSKLRINDNAAFIRLMKTALEPVIEADRDAAFSGILNQDRTKKMMRRLELINPPTEPGMFGQIWRNVFGQKRSNQTDWVNELLASGKHVHRLADWYSNLGKTSELPLEINKKGEGLWFSRHTKGGIDFNGFSSTLNGQLQLRFAGSNASNESMNVINTGLEINGLKVAPSNQQTDTTVQIHYAPTPTIDTEQLYRALIQLGLPSGFYLHNIKCSSDKLSFKVNIMATSRELNNCSFNWNWIVGSKNIDDIKLGKQELAQISRAAFDNSLTYTTQYGDWNVRFDQANNDFRQAKLLLGNDEVSFSTFIDDQCRLHWHGMSTARDATTLLNCILRHDDRLAKYSPLIFLDEVQFKNANLSGKLIIKSLARDQPDHTGITWTITPNGIARISVSEATLAYLEACKQQLPFPAVAQPFTTEQAKISIESTIKNNYNNIAFSVKVDDVRQMNGIPWVRLSMTIADWPSINLGSYPVATQTDTQSALTKAFSRDNVQSQVQQIWSKDHPRLGKVKVEFKSFDLKKALLILNVSPQFGLLKQHQLNWTEQWTATSEGWESDMSEELINRHLEAGLTKLELLVNNAIKEAANTSFDINLKVNRNAFGLDRWLKLSPLCVSLDGQIKLPSIHLGVEAVGVKLDCDGLHWPLELATICQLTIPAGQVAISDPSLRIVLPQNAANQLRLGEYRALGDITYLLGGKFTPPSYGGKNITGAKEFNSSELSGSEGEASLGKYNVGTKSLTSTQLRLDNPWLHLIYLQAELGGRLNNPKVEARGKLVLVEQNDLATAQFESSLTKLDVRAQLRTLEVRNSWLPQFDGALVITRQAPLQANARMSLAGVPLSGKLRYTLEEPPHIDGEMSGNVPMIGWINLNAKSDAKFYNPELTGYIPTWSNGWSLKVTLNRSRATYRFVKITNSGELIVQIEYPDAASFSEDKIKARLAEVEQQAKPANENEISILTISKDKKNTTVKFPPIKIPRSIFVMPKPSNPMQVNGGKPQEQRPVPIPIANGTLESETLGDSFRLYTKIDNKTVVKLNKVSSKINSPDRTVMYAFRYNTTPRVDLITFDYDAKRVQHICCSSTTTIKSINDCTKTLSHLNLFPPEELKDDELMQLSIRFEACVLYIHLNFIEAEPTIPASNDGGYSIQYKSENSNSVKNEIFLWLNGNNINGIEFTPEYLPKDVTMSSLRRLTKTTQESGIMFLIAADLDKKLIAVINNCDNEITFNPDLLKQASGTIKLKFNSEEGRDGAIEVSRRLILSSWQYGTPLPNGTCYIAGEGGCLVTEKEFLLIPISECNEASNRNPIMRLSRASFDKWDSATKRHLPVNWQDEAFRTKLTNEDIASQAVASWDRLRRTDVWGAKPIGLLMGLAELSSKIPAID
jgi:hypothetical protein